MCRYKASGARTGVGVDMLHRFVRVVLMERAVVVVMMRLFIKMQHDVRSAIAVIVLQPRVRHSERVPQQRNHKQKNGRRFAHGGNLAETRQTVEPKRHSKGC